jgi:polysaccharide chain length determinant protein (PEP-CTERM system associated)
MLGHRDMNMADYVSILRRHWVWLAVPAVLGPIIGYSISLFLPERYTSQTMVLVDQPKVPKELVPQMINDSLATRLGTLKDQVLSRARLQPLIEKNELFKDKVNKVPMEDLVAEMRKNIGVAPLTAANTRDAGVSGFTISFTSDNARTAQLVCEQITSFIIEENLKTRESRVQDTTDFLDKELGEAKAKLDAQDKRLAEFKRKFMGQLPGQENANLQLLMSANTQYEATTQALNRAVQDKAFTEANLSRELTAWQASQAGTNPQTLDAQLTVLESQLVTLEAKYTPDHPDVMKQKADIAQLKKKIAEAGSAPKDPSRTRNAALLEPASIQGLRAQLHQLTQMIAEKTREQERLRQMSNQFQSRVQLSPVVEQEHKEITRDYQTALDFYNELLTKKTQTEMSKNLEKRQASEQFKVYDPANLPERPTFPNRPMFAAGGLGAGFGLGLAIMLLFEIRDRSLRNELDVEACLQLPTLVSLPSLDQKGGTMWKGKTAPPAERATA